MDVTTSQKLRLEDQLCFALYASTNAITRVYRPLLEVLGLTYPQYLLLMVLWENGPQPMGAIARRLGLPPNAVTPLVNRLQSASLVRRKTDRHDLRSSTVLLTKKGTALEKAATRVQSAVACRTQLNVKQFAALRKQLQDLTRILEEDFVVEC